MVTNAKKPQLTQDFRLIVGANVKKFRTDAGMSQQVLADRCGIFRTYLSRAEHGYANLTVTVLAALAQNLNINITELFRE